MADKDVLRCVENPSGKHILPCADGAPLVPLPSTKSQSHDHEHHHKKSVLSKLKDKAKKLKHSLTKKKHCYDHNRDEDCSPTSTCSSSLYEDAKEENPEHYGARMYDSETAHKDQGPRTAHKDHSPRTQKLTVHFKPVVKVYKPEVQQPHDADTKPELHHLNLFKESVAHDSTTPATTADKVVASDLQAEQGHPVSNTNEPGNNKTLTETVTEMFAPAYKMVSDATQMIASKIQRPAGPAPRDEIEAKMKWDKGVSGKELGTKMMWDKGVSAKEYLRNKLEPGEEDKALSEVITEAMSPRNTGPGKHEEISMVEKVQQAWSSLLAKDEQPSRQRNQFIKAPASTHQRSSPVPLSNYIGGASPPIPVSTNPYAEVEELGGRRRWKETASICQPRTN